MPSRGQATKFSVPTWEYLMIVEHCEERIRHVCNQCIDARMHYIRGIFNNNCELHVHTTDVIVAFQTCLTPFRFLQWPFWPNIPIYLLGEGILCLTASPVPWKRRDLRFGLAPLRAGASWCTCYFLLVSFALVAELNGQRTLSS